MLDDTPTIKCCFCNALVSLNQECISCSSCGMVYEFNEGLLPVLTQIDKEAILHARTRWFDHG